MKNIFATIEYVAEKILEAITGHKNDEQAHPNLSEQINVLSTERGYLNSKEITGVSIRTLTKNGTYAIDTNTCTDIPITNQGWAYLTVKANNDSYLIHELSYLNIPNATFKYKCLGGVWGEYENFATTTKTDILVTPQPGYEVLYQKSYRINGITYLSVRVRKTDRSEFGIHQHSLFTIPHNVNRSALASTPYGDSNLELLANGVVNTIAWNNSIAYAWVGASGVYGIEVTGRLI